MKDQELFERIVTSLFDEFEKRSISFCVLRNYQRLPQANIGTDIDILVNNNGHKKSHEVLSGIAKKYNLKIFQVLKDPGSSIFRLHKALLRNRFFLQVDISTDKQYYGALYLAAEQILEKRNLFRNFYIPDPVHESLACWLPPFLYGGSIKEKNKKFIKDTVEKHKELFLKELSNILGKKLNHKVFPLLLKGKWGNIEKYRFRIRLSVFTFALFRRPIYFLSHFSQLLSKSLRYRLFPPGALVVLLGPDGSGKTTIAEKTFRILKSNYRSDKSCLMHWRPGILPQLSEVFSRLRLKREKDENFKNPHRAKTVGFLSSLFRLSYYSFDFIWGYFSRVRPKLYRGMLVIFDRYYYDFIVDPRRSRINLSSFFPQVFIKFLPHPDAVIYLDNEPEILSKRKQELPLEELKRQVRSYRNLISKIPNGYIVKGNRPVENIINEVTDIILNAKL